MEYNKYNFKIGDTAILDYGYDQEMSVKITYVTKHGLFCDVTLLDNPEAEAFSVMTARLTPNG